MKYTPWFVRGIVILLIIIVALTSCNKEENEAKITIGEVTRSVFYAPEYVAVAQGFFEEQGLEVDIQTTAGGDKTMAALLAGSVDIALVGAETSIYVYQQERKIRSLTLPSSPKRMVHFCSLVTQKVASIGGN